MADDKRKEAIEVIAREILSRAAEDAQWDSYPDIGESDWNDIVALCKRVARPPELYLYLAAYEYLGKRAEQWAREHPGG